MDMTFAYEDCKGCFHEIQPFVIHLIIIFFLQNINILKKEGKLKQNTKL